MSEPHQNEPTLDPKAAEVIQRLSSVAVPVNPTAPQVRLHYTATRKSLAGPALPVGSVEKVAGGTSFTPPMHIFRPLAQGGTEARQSFIFLHGGGWTVGDLETYAPLCHRLCNRLNANIIYVDYRLAPEHPFPAPLIDSERAVRWIFAHAKSLGLAHERIGLIGDSAGANLAAVLAIKNRNAVLGGRFNTQVLIYPCLDLTCSHDSHTTLAEGYLLTRKIYTWYVDNYLQGHDAKDWHVSPLRARRLDGLCPTIVLHAGFDPLRDEARDFVARLREDKVPVKEISFPDMMHGFVNMAGVLEQADLAVLCIRASLHTLLADRLKPKQRDRRSGLVLLDQAANPL